MLAAKTILHFESYANGRLATGIIMVVSLIKWDCYGVIYLCPSRDRRCTIYCTTSKWSKDTDLQLYFRTETFLGIGELLSLFVITTWHISLIKTQQSSANTLLLWLVYKLGCWIAENDSRRDSTRKLFFHRRKICSEKMLISLWCYQFLAMHNPIQKVHANVCSESNILVIYRSLQIQTAGTRDGNRCTATFIIQIHCMSFPPNHCRTIFFSVICFFKSWSLGHDLFRAKRKHPPDLSRPRIRHTVLLLFWFSLFAIMRKKGGVVLCIVNYKSVFAEWSTEGLSVC